MTPLYILATLLLGVALGYALAHFRAAASLERAKSDQIRLQTQLETLKTDQNRLLINYEKAFNTTELETYATTQLGMQRARDDQVYYLDSSVPDKAVVIEAKDEDSLAARIRAAFASLAEYFA